MPGQDSPAGREPGTDGLRHAEDDAADQRAPERAEAADDDGLEREQQTIGSAAERERRADPERDAGDRDDGATAALMGIDTGRLYALAMALSLGIVAIAGIFLGVRTTFAFGSGPDRLLFAFEAVIIGGLGSLWGTLVGGVILGVAQTVGARVSPGWGVLTGHLVFLAVLLLRPSGLFAKSRRVD